MPECFDLLSKLFYSDEIWLAYDLIQKMKPYFREFPDLAKKSIELQTLLADFEMYDKVLEKIRSVKETGSDEKKWSKFVDKEERKIFYRQEEGS